jgi:hypothetical protein
VIDAPEPRRYVEPRGTEELARAADPVMTVIQWFLEIVFIATLFFTGAVAGYTVFATAHLALRRAGVPWILVGVSCGVVAAIALIVRYLPRSKRWILTTGFVLSVAVLVGSMLTRR